MKAETVPYLPAGFDELFTDEDYKHHEVLASASATGIEALKPDLTTVELANGSGIKLNDLRGFKGADQTEAVVVLYPGMNGDTLGQFTRALYDQVLNPDRRYLLFPNNTRHETMYETPRRGMASKHLAEQVIEATVKLGVERVRLSGGSQGAMVGARVLEMAGDDLDVVSASFIDTPNTVDRTLKQLEADFKGKGLEGWKNLNRAVNDSGLPALTEVQHAGKGLGQRAIQLGGFARFARDSKLNVNRSLQQDMARDDFVSVLGAFSGAEEMGRHLSVVRMGDSLICPPGLQTDMNTFGLGEHYLEVPGYGHEGMDNVALNMLLHRLAIEGLQAPGTQNAQAA